MPSPCLLQKMWISYLCVFLFISSVGVGLWFLSFHGVLILSRVWGSASLEFWGLEASVVT
jgi:hypothetical protein